MAPKAYRCRVTGQPVPTSTGRGRKAEYFNEDARQFAFRMAQLGTLLERLAPEMDEAHVLRWRGEFWAMSNRLNQRMNDLRRAAKNAPAASAPGVDAGAASPAERDEP